MAEKTNGVNGHDSARQWKVGLVNSALKYLTAEQFGDKVNASGTELKKKQCWTMVESPNADPTDKKFRVYIKNHLERYLCTDKYGDVKVEEEKEEHGRFTVEYSSAGKWAFKNDVHGNYLKANDSLVKCFSQKVSKEELWTVQFDIHPQINLKLNKRGRFARLNGDQLECTEVTPWGADSMIILDFHGDKYSIRSCDNRYLNCEGELQVDVEEKALFFMEQHSGGVAFKDCHGMYLTAVGTGKLISNKKKITTPGQDELFTIQDSCPQVTIQSPNGKYVSVKQGLDVSANQTEELSDDETFQLEFDKVSGMWAILANGNKYCGLQDGGAVKKAATSKSGKTYMFGLDWQEDGTVGILGCDGKYLSNKPAGTFYSSSSSFSEKEAFRIVLINRPTLILKCEYGFIGTSPKGGKGESYICNKAKYDALTLTSTAKGAYNIQDETGKYWGLGDDGKLSSEDSPSDFFFEFCGVSVLRIRGPNKMFLTGAQNGVIKASAETTETATTWEY